MKPTSPPCARSSAVAAAAVAAAVAVAAGLVPLALGTDTAGSGRVPAMLNNIVGLKPSLGLVSTAGVVPACRTLDCVSVFALSCADADAVLKVAAEPQATTAIAKAFRFGVLTAADVSISMDGKGAWRDNVFVERVWRSVKYEEVYLRAYESVSEARSSIDRYLVFYNQGRPHSSLDGRTPDEAYFNRPALAAAA